MARVMVEQIGGQIWAESAGRGRGSCLCIRLRVANG
jgi:signal transduction histidine kinase